MIISKTPLRASFFGGGTDFADYYKSSKYGYGSVLSTALDMHVFITVNKRFDEKIRVVYTGNELVDDLSSVKHNIIREALNIAGITHGIEVVYMADLPMTNLGVGLASSSALAVGVLNALHAFKCEYVTPRQLAQEACDIEINRLGQQIGIQDQYAVAYGGLKRYRFHADDEVTVEAVHISAEIKKLLASRLHLFYTGSARDSRGIFVEKKKKTIDQREFLDPLVLAVDDAMEALQRGDIDDWGEMLDKTWEIKKQFAGGVSNTEIDNMYERAKKVGALGGKILGAGGGGFLMLYIPDEFRNSVINELKEYKHIPFAMDNEGTRIIYAD